MPDFWDRKRQELNPHELTPINQVLTPTVDRPWWVSDPFANQQAKQVPGQQEMYVDQGIIDGHDVSKAGILKGDAEECPRCPRDPRTGIRGNMYRPSRTAAMRCFDCGFIDGRDFGEGQTRAAVVEGQAQKARQVASGGAIVHNYRGSQITDRIR